MTTQLATAQPFHLNGVELLPHQEAGVGWLTATPWALLADDVGLGKTVQAAGLIGHLAACGDLRGPGPVVLWLTDAALIQQTAAELRRFLPDISVATCQDPAHKTPHPSPNTLRAYEAAHPQGPRILVAGYSWAQRRIKTLPSAARLVVLDEVMALKGGGREWEAACALTKGAARVVGMTATPWENNPVETWNILKAVGTPGLWQWDYFSTTMVEWEPGYRNSRGQWVEPKPLRLFPDAVVKFRDYLTMVMLRRTAGDAGLTLPRREGQGHVFIPLTRQQQGAYAKAERISGLTGHRLREAAGRLHDGYSSLVDAAVRELQHRPGEKVVIYCETLDVLALLTGRLESVGISHVALEGKHQAADRTAAVAAFRQPDGPQVLIGSSVLERGLNLQHARLLISLDPSWNPARESQREGRIRRIGSPYETYQHLTYLPDTPQARRKLGELQRKRIGGRDALGDAIV